MGINVGQEIKRKDIQKLSERQFKWDQRFLSLAEKVSRWSKDPSTKVGSVIVDPETQRIISLGYNGFPRGVADTPERLELRETKYDLVINAEMNALQFAERSVKRCTLYVYPLPPCIRCATQIIQAGIKRVVAPSSWPERWNDSMTKAFDLFDEAYVEVSLQKLVLEE